LLFSIGNIPNTANTHIVPYACEVSIGSNPADITTDIVEADLVKIEIDPTPADDPATQLAVVPFVVKYLPLLPV
jgi:hypothetical protein